MCFSRRSLWEEEADRTRLGSSRDLLVREPDDEADRPVPVAERDEGEPEPATARDRVPVGVGH